MGFKEKIKAFFKSIETKRLIVLIILSGLALYYNLVVLNYSVYKHNKYELIRPPLRDLLFEIVYIKGWDTAAVDTPYFLLLGFLFIWFLIDSKRWRILTTLFTNIFLVYAMRGTSILVTLMPPSKMPSRKVMPLKSIWLPHGNLSNMYGDYMFSGHVSSSTVFILTYWYHIGSASKRRIIPSIIITLIWVYICIVIILTRIHYTSDVIVALSISIPTFFVVADVWKKIRKKDKIKEEGMFYYQSDNSTLNEIIT